MTTGLPPEEDVRQKTQGGGESKEKQQAERRRKITVQSFESVSFE
jgi:hypothetical protein